MQDNTYYRLVLQIQYVINGIIFLERVFPGFSKYVEIDMLPTFEVGTSLIDQLTQYIVFPQLSMQEKIELGFIPLPEFMVTYTLEALWGFAVYCHRQALLTGTPTQELPSCTVIDVPDTNEDNQIKK